MSHIWKRKLSKLNECLDKNNFPKLRILTDTKGNVVYLDRFLEVGEMLLDFCSDEDIIQLFKQVDIIENYFKINNGDKKKGMRIAILRDITRVIPPKIEVFT